MKILYPMNKLIQPFNSQFVFQKVIMLFILLLIAPLGITAQNLKVNGKKIVDDSGNEVILRGMGLGGWMLQEPYMMEMSDIAANQTQIRSKIEALIGASATQTFYNSWLKNHFTARDADSLASWGFNSIRLPMHYNLFTYPIEKEPIAGENTWLEKGFVMVDSMVKWCSRNHIYLILDLHAAPGGQGRDAAISDYNSSKPSLWENDFNKQKTIALWKKLAQRYVNEPWVGGYDIINEPNWNFTSGGNPNGCSETSNIPLRQLMLDITNAIRQVDTKHIIIIEGNCWGNNYAGVLPPWDQNMVLSFHKYWSTNDLGSIQGIMNLRDQYNIPIWLGESGENSNAWFTDAIKLVEENDIGWAWWPLKKIGSINSPYSIAKSADYQSLLNYWKNGGTPPSASSATQTLMRLTEDAKSENCSFRKDVIDAMFRQVSDTSSLPYSVNTIPGVIQATNFDMGGNNIAYFDTDIADYHVSSGTYTSWNTGWSFRNDGVDIEPSADLNPSSNHFNVGWIADNEWMQYTAKVDSSATYNIQVRYASATSAAVIHLKSNDVVISPPVSLISTGGYQNWGTTVINDVALYKGENKIKVIFDKGGANFGFLDFSYSKRLTELTFKPTYAETHLQTEQIYIDLNKRVAESSVSSAGFSCNVNGNPVSISNIGINPKNSMQLVINLSQKIYKLDNIKISYTGGQIAATDATTLSEFSNLAVKNNLPGYSSIPGKLEAEAFYFNQGLVLETTSDQGGGQNIGYTNTGDYLDYLINVSKTATYDVEIRVASAGSAGRLEFQQLDLSSNVLNTATVNTPVTGGWQTWTTIKTSINLQEGQGKLRVKVLQPEFNLNWYNFTEKLTGFSKEESQVLDFYPNPAHDFITIIGIDKILQKKSLVIRNSSGIAVKQINVKDASSQVNIFIGDLLNGFYIVELVSENKIYRNKLVVS